MSRNSIMKDLVTFQEHLEVDTDIPFAQKVAEQPILRNLLDFPRYNTFVQYSFAVP